MGSNDINNSAAAGTGFKIFFLYPNTSIQNQVIPELIQHEYESYAVKDHNRIMRALKKHPDSIVFVNIDEKLSAIEWEKWIGAVISTLPETKFGVFSSNKDEEFHKKFNKNNIVTYGFYDLKPDMRKNIGLILELLELNHARGKRKYLRACIDNDHNATINLPFGGEFINGMLRDISVVGTSCVFKTNPALTKNTLIKDIQLRLQGILLKVEAVVFGSREDNGEKLFVLLYTARTTPEVRTKIRKYIQQNLQSKMDQEIN